MMSYLMPSWDAGKTETLVKFLTKVKLRFSTGREISGSDALPPTICPSATVVRGCTLAEEYALS